MSSDAGTPSAICSGGVAVFGHMTYLLFECCWALPIIALHWAVDPRGLWVRRRVILLVALPATAYLTVADGVALHAGIWLLRPNRIIGIRIAGVPVEEGIFFLLTNLMVVQSLILLRARGAPARRAPGACEPG